MIDFDPYDEAFLDDPQPVYARLGYTAGSLPIAERAAEEVLSLPIYPELPAGVVEQVAHTLSKAQVVESK